MERKAYISPLTKVHILAFKLAQVIGPSKYTGNESKSNNMDFEEDDQVNPNKSVWSMD